MLFRELLSLFPPQVNADAVTYALLGGALTGLVLWLFGARFSRGMIALLCTSAGAALGMRAPHLYGWNVSGAGVAVVGALAAGLAGVIFHRLIVGVCLASVMSIWAALGTWIAFHNGESIRWPVVDATTTINSFLTDLWHALPPDVSRIAPWATGTAALTGLMLVLLWPRLGVPLNWSMTGVSILVPASLGALTYRWPQHLTCLPAETWAQLTILFGMIGFGVILQWRRKPKAQQAPAGAQNSGKP